MGRFGGDKFTFLSILQMNKSAVMLLNLNTYLDGYSLVNDRGFTKYVKLSHCTVNHQTFYVYSVM